MPKPLVATRPVVMPNQVHYPFGYIHYPKTDEEEKDFLKLPSWREAKEEDIKAWSGRLQRDPALAYVRERIVQEKQQRAKAKAAAKVDPPANNKKEPDSNPPANPAKTDPAGGADADNAGAGDGAAGNDGKPAAKGPGGIA